MRDLSAFPLCDHWSSFTDRRALTASQHCIAHDTHDRVLSCTCVHWIMGSPHAGFLVGTVMVALLNQAAVTPLSQEEPPYVLLSVACCRACSGFAEVRATRVQAHQPLIALDILAQSCSAPMNSSTCSTTVCFLFSSLSRCSSPWSRVGAPTVSARTLRHHTCANRLCCRKPRPLGSRVR